MLTAAELATEHLYAALRHGLRSQDRDRQAAVMLLIEHDHWLRQLEILDHVHVEQAADSPSGYTAWIDLRECANSVYGSVASGGEKAILRLACTIGGSYPLGDDDRPYLWTLAEMIRPLDRVNAQLAADAMRHLAVGGVWNPRGESAFLRRAAAGAEG